MKRKILLCLAILFSMPLLAQLDVQKEPAKIWSLQPHIGIQFPQGDLKDRFYNNGSVGFGIHLQTRSHWLFALDWSFIFAEKVRNEDQILANITTSEGFVIDKTGVFANIHFRQRGFYTAVRAGRVFKTRFGNPNSGILVSGSLGLLQHKIRIEVHENTTPQLEGEYKKGYDKLTAGPGGSLFIGYIHYSDNKLTNFTVGAEYMYAPTKSLRNYDFVLMKKDDRLRNDQLITIRFSWIIPFYARAPKDFYFN